MPPKKQTETAAAGGFDAQTAVERLETEMAQMRTDISELKQSTTVIAEIKQNMVTVSALDALMQKYLTAPVSPSGTIQVISEGTSQTHIPRSTASSTAVNSSVAKVPPTTVPVSGLVSQSANVQSVQFSTHANGLHVPLHFQTPPIQNPAPQTLDQQTIPPNPGIWPPNMQGQFSNTIPPNFNSAAKTGSGKTLAFVIPVLEKLYRVKWSKEDGVGCIIISPTNDLAGQIWDVIRKVGKPHGFSGGAIVKRSGIEEEKEVINRLNIIVCTPGRLVQHFDETPNFDCSQLQILVIDEADQMLHWDFQSQVDIIISQIPKVQTLLFSATQTKSIKDLARVNLKNPEYISVHEQASTATPDNLEQCAMIVPLEQKLNMLWSFIKRHLKSKILVFLSSVKQVKFVYEIFKKLRPGIPLKCMHGRMKYEVQQAIVAEFNESTSVLFSTDIFARGLDIGDVDWVVQVDCPESIAMYIHRVGRTARYNKKGKSLIFLCPEEERMLEKLKAAESKIPINVRKPKVEQLEQISQNIAAVLVKFPNLQQLGKRAFVTYLKSVYLQRDKEVFDLSRFSAENFAAYASSLGLPVTPKIRFVSHKKNVSKKDMDDIDVKQMKQKAKVIEINPQVNRGMLADDGLDDDDILYPKKATADANMHGLDDILSPKAPGTNTNMEPEKVKELAARPLKKKKLKINVHRPVGTRVKYDDEGNAIDPLASLAEEVGSEDVIHKDKISQRYAEMLREMQEDDKEDKAQHKKSLHEKKLQKKMKLKRKRQEETDALSEDSGSESDRGRNMSYRGKKKYLNNSDDDEGGDEAKDLLAQQEELALKLLGKMHD